MNRKYILLIAVAMGIIIGSNIIIANRPKQVRIIVEKACAPAMTQQELKQWITNYNSRIEIDKGVLFGQAALKNKE